MPKPFQPLTGSHVASRSVLPIPLEHMAKHDPNAAWLRDGIDLHVRQPANRRSFNLANPANDRGWAHRHEEIGARQSLLPWWAVAFALGFVLYFGAQMLRAVLS